MKKSLFTLLALLWAFSTQGAQYIPDSSISPNFPRNSQLVPTGESNAVCIGSTPGPTPAITLCSTVDLTGKTLLFKLPEYTIANLPASHPLSIVTNGADGSDCVKGGGSTRVLCAWNGAAWASIGGGTGTGTGDVTDVLGTSNEICVTNSGGPQPQAGLCSTIVTDGKTLRVGRFEMTGDISPAQLTGNTDDWTPTGVSAAVTIRFSTSAVWEIRGLNAGSDGRVMTLYNVGSFVAILKNEATSSTAANRFEFGSDLTLGPKQGILIQYDSTLSRWRALSNPGKPPKYCADNGATDAYACNLPEAITTYTTGEHYFFKANTANTGQATLAFNGISSPPVIKKQVGGVTTDLENNDIRANQIVEVVFDGTNWQMLSQLGNSPTGVSGLSTGCITKATDSSHVGDSALCEDADSVNSSKSIEVGDVSTNSAELKATGITGHITLEAAALRTKSITFIIGADNAASALVNGDDQKTVWRNNIAALHITEVWCNADGGTPSINLQRDDGSPVNMLSSDLTCSTSGASTTTFSGTENAIALGDKLDFLMVSAGGVAKRVTVSVKATID